MNIYKKILEKNIPRLLNTFNLDAYSDTYGNADREYWGWKIKDFSNGSMQGGIHSLAIAFKLGLFPQKELLFKIVEAAFESIAKTSRKKGSMEEAYPNEHSFCVTALVAFDALSAINYLKDDLPKEKQQAYFSIIKQLIAFISKYDEKHAIISNHLATGVAAITIWNHLTKDSNPRDKELLEVIYEHQSDEGWYREYEGADPGYQTLCVYYLSAVYEITKDEKLKESLLKSFNYLQYFMHPDYSIGGLYGSRNTEVYYPAGLVNLAKQDKLIAEMEVHLRKGIDDKKHILPEAIDIGNFIPLLNAYAVAAWHAEQNKVELKPEDFALPHLNEFEKEFPGAGIFLKATKKYYIICNYKKGGVFKVFDLTKRKMDYEYPSLFATLQNGTKVSTQLYDEDATFIDHQIRTSFCKLNEDYPTAFKFIILRMLSLSIFRNIRLGIAFKKMIVKRLMTARKKVNAEAHIKFNFTDEKIIISEEVFSKKEIKVEHPLRSRAMHMASSGYNLADRFVELEDSQFVEIGTGDEVRGTGNQ